MQRGLYSPPALRPAGRTAAQLSCGHGPARDLEREAAPKRSRIPRMQRRSQGSHLGGSRSRVALDEFLATLTGREREFCLSDSSRRAEPTAHPPLSATNGWKLRSRVLKKFRNYFLRRKSSVIDLIDRQEMVCCCNNYYEHQRCCETAAVVKFFRQIVTWVVASWTDSFLLSLLTVRSA